MPRSMGQQRAFAMLVMGRTMTAEVCAGRGFRQRRGGARAMPRSRRARWRVRSAPCRPKRWRSSRRLLKLPAEDVTRRIDQENHLFTERMHSTEAISAFQAFVARAKAVNGRRVTRMLCRRAMASVMRSFRLSFLAAAIPSLAAFAFAPCEAQTAAPVELRILAINDFHGNLRLLPLAGSGLPIPTTRPKRYLVPCRRRLRTHGDARQATPGRSQQYTIFASARGT